VVLSNEGEPLGYVYLGNGDLTRFSQGKINTFGEPLKVDSTVEVDFELDTLSWKLSMRFGVSGSRRAEGITGSDIFSSGMCTNHNLLCRD
jgi:hypothetical protein